MKKLISVFAALALVGSLTAQKKPAVPAKPAAPAAPAAPAVAKPAAPAAPAVAAPAAPVAAPAMGANKGMGLIIDLRGSYTFSNGTTTSLADGSTSSTGTGAVDYKSSSTQGFGGGATIGFDIAPNLALVGSFDFRAHKTREWKQYSLADVAIQAKFNTMVLGLGLQPHVNALGGEVYGGGGLAVVLPFDYTGTQTYSNATATFNTLTGSRTKREEVTGYNLGLGAYGEVGYRFMFTDMIGLNIGLRAVVATVTNTDKTTVRTDTGTTTSTLTTTYGNSLTSTDTTTVTTGTASTVKAPFQTFGVTDFSANVGITLKL